MNLWKQLSCVRGESVESTFDDAYRVNDRWKIYRCCTANQNRLSLLSTSRRSSSSSSTSSDSDGSYTVWGVAKPTLSYPIEDASTPLCESINEIQNDETQNDAQSKVNDVGQDPPLPAIQVSLYDETNDELENQRAKSMHDLDVLDLDVPMTVKANSRFQARRATDARLLDLKTQKHLKKRFSRANIGPLLDRQRLMPSPDFKEALRKSFENLLGKISEHVPFGRSSSRLDCSFEPKWPPLSAEIENEVEELKAWLFPTDQIHRESVEDINDQPLNKAPTLSSNTTRLVDDILQSFVKPYVYNYDTVLTELPKVLNSNEIKFELKENGDTVIISENDNAVVYLAKDTRDRFVAVTCTNADGPLDWVDVINKVRVDEHLGSLDVLGLVSLDPLCSGRFHFTAIVSIYNGQPETYDNFFAVEHSCTI